MFCLCLFSPWFVFVLIACVCLCVCLLLFVNLFVFDCVLTFDGFVSAFVGLFVVVLPLSCCLRLLVCVCLVVIAISVCALILLSACVSSLLV